MNFKVNILIYIYLAICVCMIIFNISYVFHRKFSELRMPKKNAKWVIRIRLLLDSNTPLTEKQRRKIAKKLKHTSNLTVFYVVVKQFLDSKENEQMMEWLKINQELFNELSMFYIKKSAIEKAYYAFLMKEFKLIGQVDRDTIVRFMYNLVIQPSIYCRENALQALYSFGRVEPVVKAYELLNRNEVQHNGKLVTDGLLSFSGNQKELAEALWKKWKMFSPSYKTAFINFFRMSGGDFSERLLPILDGKASREEKFAIIRYYRKHYCEAAKTVLLEYVLNSDNEEWEFAALAATSLANYPGEETMGVLFKALNNHNWYVRFNASDSIITLAPDHPNIQVVMREKDRFAREMMEYKLSKNSVTEERKGF